MLPCLPAVLLCAQAPLEITRDTQLDPKRIYGPIRIAASNVTLDGRGALVRGSIEGPPQQFRGSGIAASGVHNVQLRNLRVHGFETGLQVDAAAGWRVEDCDFSGNFHDPDFGWGENGRRGGIVLTRCRDFTLRRNRANNNWDACSLENCDDFLIEDNDFSRCSNTCLKLWASCRNRVLRNNLSYGLRISPGEVHARDSTSVLIESGSDYNHFLRNDCTHGGDGIFVRVLNGWVSTGNRFEDNDCSFANNNAVECWAPGNTWVGNKANHSSYGFWMGGSDKSTLIGNEAAFNGRPDGFHNSPHLPDGGHAGIVFMFGPSSHTIVQDNHVHDNHGAGIALIGDQESQGAKWKAYHWIVQGNQIENNRWGIYAQHADWVDIAANRFAGNELGDVFQAGGVTNLNEYPVDSAITAPPQARIAGHDGAIQVGQKILFDAGGSKDPAGKPLHYRWDFGDGTTSEAAKVTHVFRQPGFYRVGLTVSNGALAHLAWRDAYVVEDLEEIGTESAAEDWGFRDEAGASQVKFTEDKAVRISGRSSLFALVDPYQGMRLSLLFPRNLKAGISLEGKKAIVFWLRCRNPNIPAWQDLNPIVTLYETPDVSRSFIPARDFLSSPVHNEGRDGWNYFVIPLEGDGNWKAEGNRLRQLNWLTLGFDSWGAPPLRIWLDGLGVR